MNWRSGRLTQQDEAGTKETEYEKKGLSGIPKRLIDGTQGS